MDHRAKNCKPQTLFKKKFLGKQKDNSEDKNKDNRGKFSHYHYS